MRVSVWFIAMVSQYGSKQGQNQRLKHTTSASAVSEMIVSMIVQVFRVWTTVSPRYSFTNQNPPSLTCESVTDPAPIATTSNSRLVPGELAATGPTMPAAVVMATVAEPVATRM